jgi:hypothetical protein
MLRHMKEELEEEEEGRTEGVSLRLERHLVDGAGLPLTVQHFLLTRVGNDILLEAGFFDLVELKTAIDGAKGGGPLAVRLYVRDRVMMSRETLRQLQGAVEHILRGMDKEPLGDSDDSN